MRTARTVLMASSALALLAGAPAAAQDQPRPASASDPAANAPGNVSRDAPVNSTAAQPDSTQDVIVTAQKRAQRLLDVPQSVTVVSGAALETQQATTFQDYLKLVPGLQLNEAQLGQSRIILRGINAGGVASAVAVYVDDTPFGSSTGLANGGVLAGDFDTFDIARLEVLRGPQGTLYGANSLGGLLKFVTNAPDPTKVEARVRGSVENTKGGRIGYSGNAVLNLPIVSDKLAIRASGYYRRYGGYIDSIGTALVIPTPTAANPAATVTKPSRVANNINPADSYGGRASLLFTPSQALSIRLSAILQNIDVNAPDTIEVNPFTLAELYGRTTQSQFVPQFTNTAYRLYNGTADLNLGFATLTSVTSYATLRQHLRVDETGYLNLALQGALGTPDFALLQTTRQTKFTQEVRLSTPSNRFFEGLVGGYYTHETGSINQAFQAYQPGTLTQVTGLPLLATVVLPSVYNEYAGFANGTVHLGRMFDLTLGGRYSHNNQRANQTNNGILVGAGAAPVVFPETRSSDNVFTYSVAPKININNHASIYGRVAKGYRPGGPNVLPAGAPAGTPRTYGPDTVTSYEAGFKGETPDRTFSIDVAAFHIDWNRIQLLAVVNGFGINANGGKAVSDGVEFTATVRPTQGLNLSANGAYTNARLKQTTSLYVGGFAGDQLPYSPKVSIGVDGSYEFVLTGETKAYFGASLRSLSRQTGTYDYGFYTTYGRQRRIPAYEVVDLRAGLHLGRFELEAYAKNLTNALGYTYTSTTFPTPSTLPNGALSAGVIRPRTAGIAITAGF